MLPVVLPLAMTGVPRKRTPKGTVDYISLQFAVYTFAKRLTRMISHVSVSPSQSSSAGLAFVAACGAGILWGTGALVVSVLVEQHGFTPENISFWRFVVGAVVLLTVFGRSISWIKLMPMLVNVIMAGVAMAGYVLLWFLGIEQMGSAVPTLIALCLPPVLVTAIAVARRQEQADLKLFAGTFGCHHRNCTDSHATQTFSFGGQSEWHFTRCLILNRLGSSLHRILHD